MALWASLNGVRIAPAGASPLRKPATNPDDKGLRKSATGIRGLDEITVEPGVFMVQVRRMERGESDMGVLAMARVARALEKDFDWFVGDMRTLQEHTEGLWRKNANLTRAYPADLRFPAKKEILIGLGLWEPIGPASEKHGY